MKSYRQIWIALYLIASFFLTDCRKKSSLPHYPIGGDFTLTDYNGKKFALKDAGGKPVLIFFGYTNCPDACPTILSRLRNLKSKMGSAFDGVEILFITVDPERDTPDKLKKFLTFFQSGVRGLYGNSKETADVVKLYGVYHNKRDTGSRSGYSVDHTTTLFVLDKKGEVRYLFRYADDERSLIPVLTLLMEEK